MRTRLNPTILMRHPTASDVVIRAADRDAYESQGFVYVRDVSPGDTVRTDATAAARAAAATAGAPPRTSGSSASPPTPAAPHAAGKSHTAATYPFEKHSKPELQEMAARLGIPTNEQASKGDLIGLLRGADFVPGAPPTSAAG